MLADPCQRAHFVAMCACCLMTPQSGACSQCCSCHVPDRVSAGADLSALLSEAQLAAVHEVLDAQPPAGAACGGEHEAESAPVVTMAHLRAALAGARPSIGAQEAIRLEGTYARFRDSRDPFAAASKGGQRATLA